MCNFCDALKNKNKEIIWRLRSTYSDDNICEYVNENNCDICGGCETYFKILSYLHGDDMRVSVEYYQKLNDEDGNYVYIRPFSESMQWNYCPNCGNQISRDLVDLSKEYAVIIENKK